MKCLKTKNKMTNILNYIRNIIKILIWPIIFIIGQFLLIIIFNAIFNTNKYNEIKLANQNLSKEEYTIIYNDYIKSNDYQNELNKFINSNLIIITVITFEIFFIIFYLVYKKKSNNYNDKITFNNIPILILIGVSLNISYNLTLSSINNIYHFTDAYNGVNVNIFTYIICTGILGPILEEYLFRGIIYNDAKKFNKPMKSIILTSIIFALFHQTGVQILYAFCLSFILIYFYEKYKNIIAPIIIHISSNIMNIFTCMIINKNNFILNLVLLFMSFTILYIINTKIIKKDLSTI